MKRIISLVAVAVVLCATLLTFVSCGGGDKYELVDIKFAGVTVDMYEYNYIKLNSNGTYELENKVKANDIVTKQTGEYKLLSNGKVTFTNDDIPSMNYILYQNETATLDGDTLRVEASVPGYGNVYMVFKK